MNVFEAVKQSVTTRQAAEHLVSGWDETGCASVPSMPDKNPSMKVDRRFHCFGCQADGDVIDFVSRLEDVSPKEAALILAQAFSVPMRTGSRPTGARGTPGRKPLNSGYAVWSVTASGCCVITETCCAAGNGIMPPRRQTRISTRSLWKPCKSRTMWTICWMCCSPRTWRNGQPLSSTVERK